MRVRGQVSQCAVEQTRAGFVLLYRTPRNWRITIGVPGQLTCGALQETSAAGSFEEAAAEFTNILRADWDVRQAIDWQMIRPDWWGADLVPGALATAGPGTESD